MGLNNLLNTSWEIWDFLIEKAGLDIRNYDVHIVEELCERLSIPIPCKDIKMELLRRNISPELFVGAFLKAVEPYAKMMVELCEFFFFHGVKKTNKEMKILFDFGKGPDDLGFDLKHFRETLTKYTKVSQSATIYGWNHDTLWMLARIFSKYWQHEPRDPSARDWLSGYAQNRELKPPFPFLLSTGVTEIDPWLQRTWQVWSTVVLECRKYGPKRDNLEKYADEARRKEQPEENAVSKEESNEITRDSQELPGFKEWGVQTLFSLDSDIWPEKLLRGLFGFAEKLTELPKAERMEKARAIVQQMQELFSIVPVWKRKRETLIKELVELLNLPIWNRRHELYQTWVLTKIDEALRDYKPTIHHVDGALVLRFSGTHVGTIETEKGRIHIWSELRSSLADPLGEGRKGHIQPDYSLTFEPVTVPSQTVIAVECKHYHKANPKNFADALIDYARGRPNAKVLLVNYGDIPDKILNRISDDLKNRTLKIGDFTPFLLEQIQIFNKTLLDSLPKPAGKRKTSDKTGEDQFDLIVVDVSASMNNLLHDERVLSMLEMIINSSSSAKLIAIDTAMQKEWANGDAGLQELLNLPKNGGTDLPKALSGYSLERCVILTDNQGWSQLSDTKNPGLVIEVGTQKVFYFHFKLGET